MAVPSHYNSAQDYFEDVFDFLKAYHWMYSFPNTHIFVKNVLGQFPSEWLAFLRNLCSEEVIELSLAKLLDAPSSLKYFFEEMENLKVNVPYEHRDVPFKFPVNSGLSTKKEHEIVCLAPLIDEVCSENDCNFILDVGTGLGYLPQLLRDQYGYRILGLEGNPDKVKLAKRNQLKYPQSIDSVQYVEHFITDHSTEQIMDMIKDVPIKRACITGLHACADLSVVILEMFIKLGFAKSLMIMPCCYHRLKQNKDGFDNFPASRLMKELSQKTGVRDFLNVPFLRLACQGSGNVFRRMTLKQHEYSANSCLFRAVLQDVAESEGYQVRRLKRKSGKLARSQSISESFEMYLTNLPRTHSLIGGEITDHQFLRKMHEKWTQHKGETHLIHALAGFQAAIQDICENVVLLDRVTFLKERGVKCFVVKVTDEGISPRCHALVAVKP